MKNTILRILIYATIFSLISGVVVAIIGLILGWETSTQFSDGFFWAGAIFISIGLVNSLGLSSQRTVPGLQDSESAVSDIFRGHKLLAFLMISGLLLFGLSSLAILVGRLF
ncbi:MAG: hypothetical protein P8183_18465 [Anaerolineae bacterium]